MFGLDFCCGGKRTVEEACAGAHIDVERVKSGLQAIEAGPAGEVPDASWPADELTRYIVRHHHSYVRAQLPVITARLERLVGVHGARHPELQEIAARFGRLANELAMHMMKEEQVLFPYIRSLVASVDQGLPAVPNPFGSVRNPIRMMEKEHQTAGDDLVEIRRLTSDYSVPADGCTTYRVCFDELAAFDRDLRQHVHLENNVLFPRAVALESALAASR
jgi:regulator of cell morphogenesis and NO signaling